MVEHIQPVFLHLFSSKSLLPNNDIANQMVLYIGTMEQDI